MVWVDGLMPEPQFQKPIFRNVWKSDVEVRIAEQLRYLRIGHRGLVRLTLLILLTLNLVGIAAISIVYLTSSGDLGASILLGFGIATFAVLVFRGWMLGTYVNDAGCKVIRLLTTRAIPWNDIAKIEELSSRLYGLPLRLRTRHLAMSTNSLELVMTHIFIGSIDGIFTEENYQMKKSLLQRWLDSK
jgi:hypothetical protein